MKVLSANQIMADTKTAVAIGNFDGLHIGHKMLIDNMLDISEKNNVASVVYTFVGNDKGMKRIYTDEHKTTLVSGLNPDYMYFEEFSKEFMKLSAREFVDKILLNKLNAKFVVVGENFRFGNRASADANDLKELCASFGISVNIVPVVTVNKETVSSTTLREALSYGNLQKFELFTQRHFSYQGEVVKGKQLGRQLGYPTANVIIDNNIIGVKNGVYKTITVVSGREYKSLTNVGINPTVGGEEKHTETYINDFCEDLYGKKIEIKFIEFLRCEEKFGDLESLKTQISRDCKQAFCD